jgi:60 kDa SS-A/Ro ribonucleoprotein
MLSGTDELGERTVKRKVKGAERAATYAAVGELPALIQAFEQAKVAGSKAEIIKLINEQNLPREAIPTQWLKEAAVWEALLQKMPLMAMIRNLGKMTSVGLLTPLSEAAQLVVSKLQDKAALKRARVHPMTILIAEKIYAQGRGDKGSLSWAPVARIVDALDEAFYAAFGNVEPSGKPVLLGLDVSGSMSSAIAGTCLSCREASAAMALITAATEPEYHIMGFSDRFMPLNISPKMRLDTVVQKISNLPFQGTDCSLPMVWARQNKVNVAAFVTYTDSETWAGNIHPAQALRQYRGEFVEDAKGIVVGMTSNGFTIADPNDRGMLDVVGFDATVPAVIADFVRC